MKTQKPFIRVSTLARAGIAENPHPLQRPWATHTFGFPAYLDVDKYYKREQIRQDCMTEQEREHEEMLLVPSYKKFILSVIVIVDGKLLFYELSEALAPGLGHWSSAVDYHDTGDDPAACALQTLTNHTGITAQADDLARFCHVMWWSNPEKSHRTDHVYYRFVWPTTTSVDPAASIPPGARAAKLFTRDELPNLCFPYDRDVIANHLWV